MKSLIALYKRFRNRENIDTGKLISKRKIRVFTTTEKSQIALELLRDNKNKFNLGISNVDMPDMDGFELLELLVLSAHRHPKYVMEGVKHGSCDDILKSVRIEELKNIWQHVVGKIMFKKMKSILTNGESQGNSDQNGVNNQQCFI
ncbi:hypothetical protein F2Q70_00043157 [Brassica cretica]|uniref:Response regulatory domain-containing protein n=1 Tax=Brassica cretica TaxID=69181 RepID=A0A8S9KNW4_BRACR|nr:hypothetical protein F2Q70_00043157 [Brassica cretica]KAF3517167.1 hypothetical protein DY000_02059945 [Brassica cretica]